MLPVKSILAPTDFSRTSLKVLEQAVELARHFDSELIVSHVVPPIPALPPDPHYNFEIPGYQEALHESSEKRLQELVDENIGDRVPHRVLVSYGDPAREIVRIAADQKVDMIVIGTHGLTGWQHLVFGSVAEKVVRTARCPVLSIRVRETDREE